MKGPPDSFFFYFLIQTLGIHVPILPVSEIESITSACHLNSIQFSLCKKDMIHTKKIKIRSKKHIPSNIRL